VNLIDIVFASLLANNLLFFHFLGVSEFLAEGKADLARRTAVLALLLVTASVLFWLPDHFLLVPFHLPFLRTLVLLAVLWLVTFVYGAGSQALGAGWPAPREFLVHSLLVGGIVLVGTSSPDLLEVVAAAVAVAAGYGGALVLLTSVFRRLSRERIPTLVQGLPLQLVTLGLVWLVLHGLAFAFAGKAS
jgi:electron transport complex protein RnfA